MVNEDFIAKLGWSFEEGQKAIAEHKANHSGRNDIRICVCGHLAGAHTSHSPDPARRKMAELGMYDCRPSRMVCPCEEFKPVLRAKEPRRFVRKTQGLGPLHALGQGIQAAVEHGVDIEFLEGEGEKCHGCGAEGVTVMPVALDARGVISDMPQKLNLLLCRDCIVIGEQVPE
jgi:hypothetical protein